MAMLLVIKHQLMMEPVVVSVNFPPKIFFTKYLNIETSSS